ncbi:CPBP family glutamic-type intramembrane protease [Cryobacterium sp. PH31-L1]|uniref:CPBP family intramembrane glutamic endopeptidase n=1 Tax=Cryobacterium sp. PH31-L1 TaxID=3046199 RepID=UPI0024B97F7B|nr:CPBP family glutamic-type intramembrane protease [Cryobacterium sp. PH31-L1]MDJ0376943.1 CPBP family glutamic-type intramembrane protease [Cryobacterium sp. PH31-L1]
MGVTARHSNPLVPAGIGIVAAMVLLGAVGATSFRDGNLALLLGYLCVWVPLLVAIGVTAIGVGHAAGEQRGAAVRFLRLSIRPIDLVWGLAIGLLTRTAASLIELGIYGSIGTSGVSFGETVYDLWWLFGALLAPVLLAPFVEELFFRGLVLRAVYGQAAAAQDARPPHSGGTAGMIAVAVSGLTFALMHLVTIEVGNPQTIVVVGVSTLIFGLAAASVSLATGRIGGAIVAHVTFNGLVVVPALLAF